MSLIYLYVSIHVLFLTNLKFLTTSQFCGTEGLGDYCCDNYYYNTRDKSCMECPKGSYGQNCTKTCVYPKYGWLCYQSCECADFEYCDLVDGCLNVSAIFSTSTFENSVGTTVVEPSTLSTITPSGSRSTKTEYQSTEKELTSRERDGFENNFVILVIVSVGGGFIILLFIMFSILYCIFRRKVTYPKQKPDSEVPTLPHGQSHELHSYVDCDIYMEIEDRSNSSGDPQDKQKNNANANYDQLSKSVSNSSRYSEIGKYYTDIEKYKTFTTHKALCNRVQLKRHYSWHHVIEPLGNSTPQLSKKANSYIELCDDDTYLHVVHNLKSIETCTEYLSPRQHQPVIFKSLPKVFISYDDAFSMAK